MSNSLTLAEAISITGLVIFGAEQHERVRQWLRSCGFGVEEDARIDHKAFVAALARDFPDFDRVPDWRLWTHILKAKLYECVALSLNIEPRKVRHHPQAWMTGGPGRPSVPIFCEAQSFKDRWFLAQRALGTALEGPLNPAGTAQGDDPIVNLGAFIRWAQSVEWGMPAALLELAGNEDGKRSSTIAEENRCRAWLVDLMKRGSPEKTRSEYEAEAKLKFSTGSRAFSRSWRNAVAATGNADWSKPGRKSRHRIDTPA